ncbi:MAG: hypothetical protein LBI69_03185, partial [Puniceicoccales bacterium]|nr:hypothetical protein [Puniceicoccales bacterium]
MSLSAIDAQRHISHTADSNGNPPADGQIPTGQSILGATQNLAMTPTPADDYEAVKARFFGALRAKNNIERAKIFHTASIDVVARLANEIDSSLEDSGKIIILDSETIANILKTRGMTPERVIAILSHDLLNIEKTAKILLAMDRFCFMFVATKSAQILIEMCRRNHVSRAAKIVMVMCKQCEILFAANILVTMLRTSEESSDNSGISILDYMLKNSSDKAIIIKIFLAMNRFISKEILENNQAVCEILVRTLCDESMSCKNLVAFFDKMLCLSSEFRDIACKAIAQMESENAAKAKECLGKLPIVSVGYIFEEKLKSTSDAVIFWKKIWPLDPKKAMKIFPGSTNDRNLTESFAAFLLEMDRQNSENPGTLPSVSELLLCESFYRGAVAKILTCSLMPEEKAIEITGKMYRLNFKETIKIFTEVVEIGMSDTRSRDIGIKIFLKIDEIDSENPANLSSVIEILLMKYPSMKSFIRYEFSTSNLVDIDRVVKILKELHGARFPLAMKVFKYLLRRNPRAAEIFLKFYQAADCRQMAMKILSDDTIKPKDIIKLLLNDSL